MPFSTPYLRLFTPGQASPLTSTRLSLGDVVKRPTDNVEFVCYGKVVGMKSPDTALVRFLKPAKRPADALWNSDSDQILEAAVEVSVAEVAIVCHKTRPAALKSGREIVIFPTLLVHPMTRFMWGVLREGAEDMMQMKVSMDDINLASGSYSTRCAHAPPQGFSVKLGQKVLVRIDGAPDCGITGRAVHIDTNGEFLITAEEWEYGENDPVPGPNEIVVWGSFGIGDVTRVMDDGGTHLDLMEDDGLDCTLPAPNLDLFD